MPYLSVFLIGVIAGLRAMTPFAAVSWAAALGWLHLESTWMSFMGASITPYITSLLALGEIINDKLPKTPSRKEVGPFGARIVMGAFCGAALGTVAVGMIAGAVVGAIGAVAGTMGGYEGRKALAGVIGKDMPAALIEDAIAVIGAYMIVCSATA